MENISAEQSLLNMKKYFDLEIVENFFTSKEDEKSFTGRKRKREEFERDCYIEDKNSAPGKEFNYLPLPVTGTKRKRDVIEEDRYDYKNFFQEENK